MPTRAKSAFICSGVPDSRSSDGGTVRDWAGVPNSVMIRSNPPGTSRLHERSRRALLAFSSVLIRNTDSNLVEDAVR